MDMLNFPNLKNLVQNFFLQMNRMFWKNPRKKFEKAVCKIEPF